MFGKLCEILEEFADISKEEMQLESDILNDLGMNSIDVMEAVVKVEEVFFINIPDRIISNFRKLEDVVNYLESNIE